MQNATDTQQTRNLVRAAGPTLFRSFSLVLWVLEPSYSHHLVQILILVRFHGVNGSKQPTMSQNLPFKTLPKFVADILALYMLLTSPHPS